MTHWLAQFFHPGQLRTPYGGYWFWSGIGSDSWIAGIGLVLWHQNCHEKGCPRVGRHHHSESGTRWCRKHLPDSMKSAFPKNPPAS